MEVTKKKGVGVWLAGMFAWGGQGGERGMVWENNRSRVDDKVYAEC